ncbi:MAG: 3-deoxy-7-phosphoheptulonate synthase [Oscillospiraceae bacterium]|nr:3-deoxy-7-phosphoheptulonate synthase [Oscillospiraceae bacterium]
MNMDFLRKLPIPADIKEQFPVTEEIKAIKQQRDAEIQAIFTGESDKFLLVIGPCSADHEASVLDYVSRLAVLQEKVKDKIVIVPRIYTNKPRTTGQGYKGMVHQPNPAQKPDMLEGIIAVRRLHTRAISETGLTCADEMLYPENHRYLSDLLSYVAVGARSVENQQHRLTASGLDIPVGMKNPTGGDFSIMLNAIIAAQSQHTFLYRGWECYSHGNPLAHAILRGSSNKHGQSIPNYHYEDVVRLYDMYAKKGLENMAVVIDTNHSNSDKKYLEQIRISREIMNSRNYNPDMKKFIKGLMIESYIVDGCQKVEEGTYGKSITDPCLGWEKSERLVLDIADMVK